jgi:alkanesulfonate monooxygenase SsuD/methylene tetrahydromethanopterin reductase-like flavin-dependent oxidoreductase (luciferase family)
MTEKKLGYNIRIKAEKVNHEIFKEYLEIAKKADDAGLYYLAFPEFFGRFDRNRVHVIPYMTAIAAHTEHAKLGPDVLQVPFLHPKHIADIGSSLDIISNGRFVLGVGTGWVPSEFEKFGISFKERGKITNESLDIIIKLWTEPAINDYRGKFFTFKDLCSPPTVQKPHPPIWVGGASDAALRRTAQYGNAWAPTWWLESCSGLTSLPEGTWNIKERLEKLKMYCKKFGKEVVIGREPKGPKEVGYNQRIHVNINPDKEKALEDSRRFSGVTRKAWGPAEMKMRDSVIGNAGEVIEKLEEIYDSGAYLVTLYPLSADSKTQWDRIEKEVLPSL